MNEAGENLSTFIWDLLLESTYSNLANEISSSIFGMSTYNVDGVLIETAVSDIEQLWFSERYKMDEYWMNISKKVAQDTINQISFDDFFALLNQFQPESMQGFVAAYALQNGHEIPEWVRPNFRPDVYNLEGNQLPFLASDEGLPPILPSPLTGDFLNWSGNVLLLHCMYIAERKVYFPTYTEIINSVDPTENGKNAQLESNTSSSSIFGIYPNPFSSELIFRFNTEIPEYKVLRIEIFDLLGRRARSEQFGAVSIFTIDWVRIAQRYAPLYHFHRWHTCAEWQGSEGLVIENTISIIIKQPRTGLLFTFQNLRSLAHKTIPLHPEFEAH